MLRLTPEQHEQLKAYAKRIDRPLTWVVRKAIEEYISD
jgi:predicted DNA-binding protein